MTPFIAAVISYLLMLVAYFQHKHRLFHMITMASSIVFDVSMPIFLVTHRHWWHRLVEQGDMFSFLVWMHFGLLITLYALEGVQILTARQILKGNVAARSAHRQQGRALLMVRGLVIFTGGILA